jgi:hypothetical protein
LTAVISSWSRRRAAVAAEAEAENQLAEQAVLAQEQEAIAEKTDDEILEELGLPDPDTLVQGDDFKVFLSKAVPAHIRKRALRKLWRSNPVLACVDGLNDYDDDYLTGSFGQDPIKTSYQVGKGMLAHLLEVDRQKEVIAAPVAEEVSETPEVGVEQEDTSAVVETLAAADDAIVEEPSAPAPRRMQFQFEDDTA